MAIAAALAIICYVSPNPTPLRLSVSGAPAQIAAIEAQAAQVTSIRLVAAAEDRGIAFARFEIGAEARYRDIGGLIFNAQRSGAMLASGNAVASCPDGGMEDLGDAYAPVLVGLIGDDAALDRLKPDLAWTQSQPLSLADGRKGVRFAPRNEDEAAYGSFVQRAATGKFQGVEVVWLRPD